MKSPANRIERELQSGEWKQCALYENELQHLWPLEEEDREAKIAEFAKTYGLLLRFYQKGLCAIFDKLPRGQFTQPSNARLGHIKVRDLERLKHVIGGGGVKHKSKRPRDAEAARSLKECDDEKMFVPCHPKIPTKEWSWSHNPKVSM